MSWKGVLRALWTATAFILDCVALVCLFLGAAHGLGAISATLWFLLDLSELGRAAVAAYYALLSLFWGGLGFTIVVITNVASRRIAA